MFRNRDNLGITYQDLRHIINQDNNTNREIRKDILLLFLKHYELYDRKLKKGLNPEEDIIEPMEIDNDPNEGVYLPLYDEEIILYLYDLLMSPEIIENGQRQPIGDYTINMSGLEQAQREQMLQNEIEKINARTVPGGKIALAPASLSFL